MNAHKELNVGELCVFLHNMANVDEELIKDVISRSGIDKGTISLALGIKKLLRARNRGETIPDENPNSKADVNIAIREDVTDDWEQYKPHVAFVLCHELEHARIIQKDLSLHYCLTWLFENNKNIFDKAGKEPVGNQFSFLHEKQCNLKGKSISIELFGSEDFEDCLKRLRGKVNKAYKENIDFLLSLQGKSYNDDVYESLKKDICSYYSGIESEVHSIWDQYPSSNFNLKDFITLHK